MGLTNGPLEAYLGIGSIGSIGSIDSIGLIGLVRHVAAWSNQRINASTTPVAWHAHQQLATPSAWNQRINSMKKNLSFDAFDRPEVLLNQTQQEKIKGGFGIRNSRPDLVSSPGSRITWDGIDIRKTVSGNRLSQQFSIRGGNVTHDIEP